MSASGPARHDSSAHRGPAGYFDPGLGPGGTCLVPGDPKPGSRPSSCYRSCPDPRPNHLKCRNVLPGLTSRLRRASGQMPQPGLRRDRANRRGCAVLDPAGRSAPARRLVSYRPLFWISLCGPTDAAGLKLLPRNENSGLSFRRDVCNVGTVVCAIHILRPKRILPRAVLEQLVHRLSPGSLSLRGHSYGRSHGRTVSEVGTIRVRPVESKTFVPGTRLGGS